MILGDQWVEGGVGRVGVIFCFIFPFFFLVISGLFFVLKWQSDRYPFLFFPFSFFLLLLFLLNQSTIPKKKEENGILVAGSPGVCLVCMSVSVFVFVYVKGFFQKKKEKDLPSFFFYFSLSVFVIPLLS